MELVYLWVEEYKNIKKQGFNFSPRFTCKYDEESKNLTIDENEDYIEDFFGENINVTAIVGKNGSGKSNLLKLLEGFWNIEKYTDKPIFMIYKIDTEYYCMYFKISQPIIKGLVICKFSEMNMKRFDEKNKDIYFGIDWIAFSEKVGKNGLSYYRINESIPGSTYDTKMKNNYFLGDNQFFVPQYINTYKKNQKILEKLEDIYSFDTLRIKLKNRSSKKFNQFTKNDVTEKIIKLVEGAEVNFLGDVYNDYISEPIGTEGIDYTQQLGISIWIGFVEFYLKNSEGGYFDVTLLDKLEELARYIKDSKQKVCFEDIISLIENIEIELGTKYFAKDKDRTFKDIIDSINFMKDLQPKTIKIDKEFCIDMELKNIDINDVMEKIERLYRVFDDDDLMVKNEDSLRIIEIDLVNSGTNATYQTLSSGEKQFLRFSIEFFQKLFYISMATGSKSFILLADEIDNSLHPLWKKKVIFRIIDLFQAYAETNEKINLHLVFSTHSPFLLSDIPKQNIIFLDKNQDGNCKVVNGLEEKKETFGANIHTLLSDSFFMEDGLMGEFAKSKIKKIIKFHEVVAKAKNNDADLDGLKRAYEKKKKRFWDTQSIIGEDYLKQVVKNHLLDIESILLGKDEAKNKEIRRLREEADRLEELR